MEKKHSKLKWEDVESAIDNLNKEDLKIWISDLLYLPEELDKAREEGRREGSEITSRYISDFVKSESGKSGRKEILEYIEELSKLKQ
jgi:hypothetical protein